MPDSKSVYGYRTFDSRGIDMADKKKVVDKKVNRKRYMLFAVIATVLLLVLMVVFYARVIYINREKVLNQYSTMQSRQVELLADSLSGKDEQEIIDDIKSRVEMSGENWAYVLLDNQMIFMRDDNTTDNLAYLKAAGVMDEYLEESGGVYNSSPIPGTDYVCGMYTGRDYILSSYSTGEFENYIILGFVATFLALGVMLIQYSVYLNRTLKEKELLERELHDRNNKFREYEKLSAGYKEQILDYQSGQKSGVNNVYDMDIVDVLLSKSEDAELYPICFMYVSVVMAERYYSKDELMDIMEFVKGLVKQNHVTAEISKGFYTVIMYRTDIREADDVRRNIMTQWKNSYARKNDTEIKTYLYQVKADENPREAFYREKDGVEA